MSALGADPAQLDDLARDLDQLASMLDHRRLSLTVWIEGDRFWRGHRAGEFRHAWEHQFSPQVANAVSYLHDAVRALHDNANQQRVASGEQPRDYGAGGFLSKVFGDTVHAVEGVASSTVRAVEDTAHQVAGDVRAIANEGYKDFAALGGSELFQKSIAALDTVSKVAGVVALIPIPGLQEVAAGVALATGAAVLVGHLAEMANKGSFDGGEFAGDALGVAGGGLSFLKDAKSVAGAAKAAQDVNILATKIPSVADIPNIAKTVTSASSAERITSVAIVGTRVASSVVTTANTTVDVYGDVSAGDWAKATNDSFGYVSAGATLAGSDVGPIADLAQNVGGHVLDQRK